MRIAHFIHRYPPALGGAEAYFARLGRYLAGHDHDVTVFTTTAIDLEAFWSARGHSLPPGNSVEDGVTVRRYRPLRFPGLRLLLRGLNLIPHRTWQCLTMPCNPLALGIWHDAGHLPDRFDLVHASPCPHGLILASGLRMASRLGVPFVVTPFLHTGDPDEPNNRTRRGYLSPALCSVLRAADCVFVQTPGERDALLQKGCDASRVVLQGLGVEPGECTGGDRGRARRRWGVGTDEVVVGHLANNSREKGTVDLLLAADTAWGRGQRFHVVLAGPRMPNFRRFRSGHRPAGPVHEMGPLSDEERRDFFAGIDVFALPSRVDSFGLVLLEAWACGVPNLGYRAGGIAGVIRDEHDGLLVRPGDIDSLADAVGRLVSDAGLRVRLGEAGQKRTRTEFRWEDKLDLVRRTYESLIVGESTPAACTSPP